MSANPAQNYRTIRRTRHGDKKICVNHGWNYSSLGAFTFRVFGNRTIATGNYAGPAYQVVSFTKPFQCLPKLSVSGASIGNVCSVIQIEHHRASSYPDREPFDHWRSEYHGLALNQNYIRLARSIYIDKSQGPRFQQPQSGTG